MRFAVKHALVLGLVVTCVGCKSRTSAALKAEPVRGPLAWFPGADRPMRVCIQAAPGLEKESSYSPAQLKGFLKQSIQITYARWLVYMINLGMQPAMNLKEITTAMNKPMPPEASDPNKFFDAIDMIYGKQLRQQFELNEQAVAIFFPSAMVFQDSCDGANLEFHFGTKPTFETGPTGIDEKTSIIAEVQLAKNKVGSDPWPKGAVIVSGSREKFKYDTPVAFSIALLHEWGHVLGVPHVRGTVMDPEILAETIDDLAASEGLMPGVRLKLFTAAFGIDHWRKLAPCRLGGCLLKGVAFGQFQATSEVDKDLAVKNFSFTLDKSFQAPTLKPTTQVTLESEENLIELFRRPDKLNAIQIFHSSRTVQQWLSKDLVVKTYNNTNEADQPATKMEADCNGKKIPIFEELLINNSTNSIRWWPSDEKESDAMIQSFQTCKGADAIYTPAVAARFREVKQGSKAMLVKLLDRSQWQISGGAGDVPMPKGNVWCATIDQRTEFCVWREGRLGAAMFNTKGLGLLTILERFLDPIPGGMAEGWGGAMKFARVSSPANGGTVQFRVAFDKKVEPNLDSFKFQLEISTSDEIAAWVPYTNGTLKRKK